MKFALLSAVFLVSVSAVPVPSQKRAGVDPSLVPEFGIVAGTNPTGTGDCDGVNGVKIPCSCPPDRDAFIASLSANVAAGHDVNNTGVAAPFPTDSSSASQIVRLQTSVTTLQNLHGAGVGCPASSTTFLSQIAALQSGSTAAAAASTASAPAAAAAAAPSTTSAPAAAGALVDASLVPEFGVTAGQSPNGSGSCVGINNVLIPCTCPPDRNSFIAVRSSSVSITFADLLSPSPCQPTSPPATTSTTRPSPRRSPRTARPRPRLLVCKPPSRPCRT
ncbi:hypothetical protein B0H11DRAFT_1975996 [Mycena galericulata]|nr:hypothetical protein B0H11DRAFT_1975996 [Mycena galericulata]